MHRPPRHALAALLGALLFPSLAARAEDPPTWPQWGGPHRNFQIDGVDLADSWPADGPHRSWERPLGEGFSSIVSDGVHLYTMYREGDAEVVVALRADSGKTVWEHRYLAPPREKQTGQYGKGPQASPLLLGDRLVTIGFTSILHCLSTGDGKPLWSCDLVKDLGGDVLGYGYSASPVAYEGLVIALVGSSDCGVVALRAEDGEVAWKSGGYPISYASPILIEVSGRAQLVFFTPSEIVGIDPRDGEYLWSELVENT